MKDLIENDINPIWGILQAQGNVEQIKTIIDNSQISMVRVPIYFADSKVTSNVVDDYLKDGYCVEINFNWKATGRAVEWPPNDAILRSKTKEFFDHYAKYRDLIPVVVVENEWDNLTSLHGPGAYHTGTIKQYLNELAITTEIAHEYGFKVASAGITGNNLQRWAYSKLTGDQQRWWKQNYFIGEKKDYELMVRTIDEFCAGVKNISTDYANTHWYNRSSCAGGYPIAAKLYTEACGKTEFINNEFGIKTNILGLFAATIAEVKLAGAKVAIIYSGTGKEKGGAIRVTDEMITTLK